MNISTRHTRGGYRTVMSVLQSRSEPFPCRALALRSAFVWADQPIGEEFWHRAWTSLRNNQPLSGDAERLIKAMASASAKTVFPAEARDHDRLTLKEISRIRLEFQQQKKAA